MIKLLEEVPSNVQESVKNSAALEGHYLSEKYTPSKQLEKYVEKILNNVRETIDKQLR